VRGRSSYRSFVRASPRHAEDHRSFRRRWAITTNLAGPGRSTSNQNDLGTTECRHCPGERWLVDETYLKVARQWVYLYRAIDQFGQVIDVLVSQKRDLAATRRFFTRALEHGPRPSEVTTDRAPPYPRVLDELLPAARHVMEQYANNPLESTDQSAEPVVASEAKAWLIRRMIAGREGGCGHLRYRLGGVASDLKCDAGGVLVVLRAARSGWACQLCPVPEAIT